MPLHSREPYKLTHGAHHGAPVDKRIVFVDGKPALEYDGLRNGELAWVLGRRFKTLSSTDSGNPGALDSTGGFLDELNDSQRYAHQAYAGLGNGVDRMQRLASTEWVEAMVQDKIGSAVINLHAINPASGYSKAMDSNLMMHAAFLAGSTALYANDVAHSMVMATGNDDDLKKLGNAKLQGIFVKEMGPFLRGVQVSADAVQIRDILGSSVDPYVSRNMGDTLCFSALETEIRRRNLMDWTPDGIVLSKLESPTDEPMKSIEMDARSAQLFNVAIHGPAITTSWTTDVRDYKLECQPMDRVFVCLVADLAYTESDGKDNLHNFVKQAREAHAVVVEAVKALRSRETESGRNAPAIRVARNQLHDAMEAANSAANAIIGAVGGPDGLPKYLKLAEELKALEAIMATPEGKENGKEHQDQHNKRTAALNYHLNPWNSVDPDEPEAEPSLEEKLKIFEKDQNDFRTGKRFVKQAVLTNFRLMRSTSSHMANYSHWTPGSSASRMGLHLGKGVGQYIIGAWCIGTVVDSAASRSTVGTLVRTAPASMALNVAVNIEWWSGDKLYKHYMDTSSSRTLMRGQVGGTHKRARLDGDTGHTSNADTDVDWDPLPSAFVDFPPLLPMDASASSSAVPSSSMRMSGSTRG